MHYWLEQRNEKANYMGQALQLLAEEFPNDGVQKSPSSGRSQCRVDVVNGLLYGRCMIFLLRLTPPATSSLIVMPRYPVSGHRGMIDGVEEITFFGASRSRSRSPCSLVGCRQNQSGAQRAFESHSRMSTPLPILCRNDGPRHRTMELILISGKFPHNDGLNLTHLSYNHD